MQLINGDCLQELKKIGGATVDLVVIDPPYAFDEGGGAGAFGSKRRNYHEEYLSLYHNEHDVVRKEGRRLNAGMEKHREDLKMLSCGFDVKVLDELCRVMKKINIYIWCSKKQVSMLLNFFEQKKCNVDILTWHKTNPIPTCNNTYLNDTEYLIFAREKGVYVGGNYSTKHKFYVTKANVEDKKLYKHPTIKPCWIIENLIFNSSEEGQTVLDCFMGSGTTGVACKRLKRDFIGIEIDKTYFDIASARIENETGEREIVIEKPEEVTQMTIWDI